MAVEQAGQGALEDCGLRARSLPLKGITPGPFHVADDGQGAAARMSQERRGQRRQKGFRSDLGAVLERLLGEIVTARRAGAVTGEEKGEETAEGGVGSQVVAGEIEVLGDGAFPGPRPRPVAAEERTLVRALPWIAHGEFHAVTGGEEEGRRLPAAEEPRELGLGGGFLDAGAHLPVRPRRAQGGRDRRHQALAAHPGGGVAGVLDAEEAHPTRQIDPTGFRGHDARGVMSVVLDAIEREPAHRVLHVELGLEAERHRFRAADQEQVVGHLRRIGRSRSGTVAGEELRLRLVGPKAVRLFVHLEQVAGLLAAQREQRRERLADRRIGVVGEDDSPTGLVQPLGVHPLLDAEVLAVLLFVAEAQLGEVLGLLLAAQKTTQVLRRHRRQAVAAGGTVDTVEREEVVGAVRHAHSGVRLASGEMARSMGGLKYQRRNEARVGRGSVAVAAVRRSASSRPPSCGEGSGSRLPRPDTE